MGSVEAGDPTDDEGVLLLLLLMLMAG